MIQTVEQSREMQEINGEIYLWIKTTFEYPLLEPPS